MMQQTKVSLSSALIEFLEKHKNYGYKDKSTMVRAALSKMQEELEKRSLEQSADLYAELYEEDQDLQSLTESALSDWPE